MSSTRIGDPLVGRLLDGRYSITSRLARGGMATVYRAVDTRLTRTVAVKVMHVGLGDDADFARKLDREARAAARLSHPNVVSIFDQGQGVLDDGNRPYLVMEYVDGHTLRDVIAREAPLPPQRALALIDPVLAALAAAHEAGLVHRDVKPENVLISGRGQVKVADFGLAKAITSQTQTATQGMLMGTLSYLPPELVVSGRADARSDVYSVGVVLFELLTGCKPHVGETPIQVAYAHVHHDVPAPSTLAPAHAGAVPPYLDLLVTRAAARDPQRRPPEARAMLLQVRRVEAALRAGVRHDPQLMADLAPTAPAAPPAPAAPSAEATRVVAPGVRSGARPVPAGAAARTTAVRPYGRPTGVGLPAPGPAGGPAYGRSVPDTTPHPRLAGPAARVPGPRYLAPSAADAPPPAVSGSSALAPAPGLAAARLAALRERQRRRQRRGWLVLLLVLLLAAVSASAGRYLAETLVAVLDLSAPWGGR